MSFCLTLLLVVCAHTQQDQKRFVQIEVVISPRSDIHQSQAWSELLSDVGADGVRLHRGTASRPAIDKSENSFGATYKITAILNDRNRLSMPGGTFSLTDKARIGALIKQIKDDGAEVALAEKMAFGLTAEQLVDLHTDLSRPFEQSTAGTSPSRILEQVRQGIKTPMLIDAGARRGLAEDYTVLDEMQGLTHGTVLAAALRPVGLVLAPRREQGKPTEIVITDSESADEHWPIGWPLQVRPSQAAPKLFDKIPANIQNFVLKSALTAISTRLELPFLYDHNSLARAGIDLDEVRVNFTAEEATYNSILRRILAQSQPRLQMEFRADEIGAPFLWISTR